MHYLSEIDGLRALAVIPVILFHAWFRVFSYGCVGVDIFFVNSGYLITCIMRSEPDDDKFKLINIYERPAWRILPPFFVKVVCLAFTWLWLAPEYLKSFGQSLTAVSLFHLIFYFGRKVDIFAHQPSLNPYCTSGI